MTTNKNELVKVKTTLVFKKCLAFAVAFAIFILLLLNCANLFFAGLITKYIVIWVNSLFNYTIPHTIPTWFCFYVFFLYIIILFPLLFVCGFLVEKLEDIKKYNISFDIKYLRTRMGTIKNEMSENLQLNKYNSINNTSAIDEIIEQQILPEQRNLLESQNIKTPNSISKTLNENSHDLDSQKQAIEIDLTKTDSIKNRPIVKSTTESSPKNKTNSPDNDHSSEKKGAVAVDSLNPNSHLEKEIEMFSEDKTQSIISQESDSDTPINVIDSLNEIFISKENVDTILEKNEITEINSILPKISAEDYIDRNKAKQDIGLKGEYFILRYEKSELIKNNRTDLAIKVRHISKDEGDHVGYDILSYDEHENEKYIEVKTSVKGYTADFFLTENEMNKIKKMDNYFIYRVFDFDTQSEKGNLYIVNCKKDFVDYFTIQPTQYKISPRKK